MYWYCNLKELALWTHLASKSSDRDAKIPHQEANTISWNKSGVLDPMKTPKTERYFILNQPAQSTNSTRYWFNENNATHSVNSNKPTSLKFNANNITTPNFTIFAVTIYHLHLLKY